MRVLHLSTYESAGGAARAACGLHRGLLGEGVASRMLVLERQSDDPTVEQFARDHVERRVDEITTAHWGIRNRTPVSNTALSITFGGCDVAGHPAVRDADILNLHWIPGLLDVRGVGRILGLGKPVVWTLHDEWAYTGACHFTAGCERWRTRCGDCPQLRRDPLGLVSLRFAERLEAFGGERLTVVGPSRWIARRAAESPVLRGSRTAVIPYGVDLGCFRPGDREPVRARLGLAAGDFAVAFNAAEGRELRKGAHELKQALGRVRAAAPAGSRLRMIVTGAPGDLAEEPGAVALGFVRRREEMAEILSACDLLVIPSLEDNLPNGVLESLACGTPCVGFDAGGIPDMLDGAPGSATVATGDIDALAQAILAACRRGAPGAELRAAVRAHAESRFAPERQARAYLDLYEGILSGGQRR